MQPEVAQRLLIRTTLFFWGVTKATGWKMWLADRSFPMAPPFDWMYVVPPEIHLVLATSSFLLMSWLFYQPERFSIVPYLLLVILLSDCLDQNRWQPWEYLFITLLLVFHTNRKGVPQTLSMTTFVLAALYFYSGVSKFHAGFLYGSWHPLFLNQLLQFKDPMQHPVLFYAGYSIPIFETIGAVGLLFTATRKASAMFFILMHAALLLLVGPAGLNYNWIIWPWNLYMMVLLYLVAFRMSPFTLLQSVLLQTRNLPVVIAWGLLPATYYLDLWDAYLSAQLYSGSNHTAVLCLPRENVPPALTRYVTASDACRSEKGTVAISLNLWAMGETNVPPYPEIRVYRNIKRAFEKQYPGTDATLLIIRYPYTRKEILKTK